MNQIEQEVYNLKDDLLFEIDSLKIPYLFISDEHDKVIDLHIPILDDLSYTEEFLQSLLD